MKEGEVEEEGAGRRVEGRRRRGLQCARERRGMGTRAGADAGGVRNGSVKRLK